MDGLAGAGKSTLAAGLAATLRAEGHRVDLFGEEQLFTRPDFAVVAEGFRTKRFPTAAMFEAAYQDYFASLIDHSMIDGSIVDQWTVMDWSAAGMVGDLDWAMQDRAGFVTHLRSVMELNAPRQLILLNLSVDPAIATERAARQRGAQWITRYDELARNAGIDGIGPIDRIIERARTQLEPAAQERAAAREAGWTIIDLDASGSSAQVRRAAYQAIKHVNVENQR